MEGAFWRKIAKQGPRNLEGNETTQGLYIASAAGELYAYTNNRGPWQVRAHLESALKRHHPSTDIPPLENTPLEERFDVKPPHGSRIIRVHAKVLDGYEAPKDDWEKIFQESIARDNLWITEEELVALRKGTFLESLTHRLVRYHLVDNTRGEPVFWKNSEIRAANLTADADGTVRGKVQVERADASSGYEATVLGHITFEGGKLTRFDLVALGDYWGHGPYTKHPPKGRFPLGVSFRIPAKPSAFDAIPPQGTKGWSTPYLEGK